MTDLTDSEKKVIIDTVDAFEREDKPIRDRQLKDWKELDCLWRGVQYRLWSEIAGDWQSLDEAKKSNPELANINQHDYERFVNIIRAHGESIIAALAATIPSTRFYPDDADNPNDIQTSKAYSDIEDKIRKDNSAEVLFVDIFFKLATQGLVALYNYHNKSEAYGVHKEPITEDQEFNQISATCQDCGAQLDTETEEPIQCPECNSIGIPFLSQESGMVEVQTGEEITPKGREIIDVYGPLNVKIPHWIKKLEFSPYLILETEQHLSFIKAIYGDDEKLEGGSSDVTEIWARRLENATENKMETVKRCWIRPWAFNILTSNDVDIQALQQKYPNGAYTVIINNKVVECHDESMDDHWTISESPLSNYIHADPLLKPLIPIQDMKTELLNLTMETIEQQIPQVFADPNVLNFTAYGQNPARPGTVYPAKPKAGANLQDGFYVLHTAALSQEIEKFDRSLDMAGQFVTGAFPSIYGGMNVGGSKTAHEYEVSKQMALQRLSISWKVVNAAWAKMMGKSVKSFAQNLTHDERFVRNQNGGFVNVWIRKDFLSGNIGMVEPEISDQFPISWAQVRSFMMELLQMNNDVLNSWLLHPSNLGVISKALGIKELNIPGESDREKQLTEIQELLTGEQVMPEQYDNPQIHIEVLKEWLNSYEGQYNKKINPRGYMNVQMHAMMHEQVLKQLAAQQAMMQQNVEPLPEGQ